VNSVIVYLQNMFFAPVVIIENVLMVWDEVEVKVKVTVIDNQLI